MTHSLNQLLHSSRSAGCLETCLSAVTYIHTLGTTNEPL